jgi:hypothetical protein
MEEMKLETVVRGIWDAQIDEARELVKALVNRAEVAEEELDTKLRAVEEQRAKFAQLYTDAMERGNKLEAALGKAQALAAKQR